LILGKIYDGKFYFLNDFDQNEVYDFQSKTWNSWPAAPHNVGYYSCLVNWKNNFIIFGGTSYQAGVQKYNIQQQVMQIQNNITTI